MIEYDSQNVYSVIFTVLIGSGVFTLVIWGWFFSLEHWSNSSILIAVFGTIVVNVVFIFNGMEQLVEGYLDSVEIVTATDEPE